MARFALFLDDGGVISDNIRRAEQWQRLVGEFFAPLLGGSAEAWAEANRAYATALFEPAAWEARLRAAGDYNDFQRTYLIDWLGGMCALLGIPRPPDEESVALAERANNWITSQVRANFPGAADAIRLLWTQGHTLYTASGESSSDLENYLGNMGVRDCFTRLYGGDLINMLKAGPDFYEKLLADSGVLPAEAIVVDDNVNALKWAAQVGMRTVLVSDKTEQRIPAELDTTELFCIVGSLAELPAALDKFA